VIVGEDEVLALRGVVGPEDVCGGHVTHRTARFGKSKQ
jgi:hypothetical protein